MCVFTIRSEFQTARHPSRLWKMAAGQLATYPPDRAAACPALLPTQRALLTGHVRLPHHIKVIYFLFSSVSFSKVYIAYKQKILVVISVMFAVILCLLLHFYFFLYPVLWQKTNILN